MFSVFYLLYLEVKNIDIDVHRINIELITWWYVDMCSKEQMQSKLLYAINAEAGFDLS